MHDLTRRHRAMLMGFGLLLNISLLAQCPTGDVLITSQTDADNYASTFPNCDTLPGDLVFSGINIDDLSGFAHVEVIQAICIITTPSQAPTTSQAFSRSPISAAT
ncbi:MAG: hypothetical protein IPL77_07445 [Flavobacteriales bacterium]|nr:hypothetical protein [Flavobacteriales bacterium]